MACPGLEALFVARFHLPAGGGAPVVGLAAHRPAHGAHQRGAVGLRALGAAHAGEPGIDLFGELRRQPAGLGLGPGRRTPGTWE